MDKRGIEPAGLFIFSLSLTILFLIGFALIRRFAIVKEGDTEVCRSWPKLTLIGAFGIVLAFFVMTFIKMDANARARLASAQARALAQAVRISPGPVPKDQNAALIYEKLAEQIDAPNWLNKISEADFIPEVEKARDVLDKNQKAFSMLRRAAVMADASLVPDAGLDREWPGFRAAFPDTTGVRQAVRLLALDAYIKALNGETGSSLESINGIGTAARHVSRTPNLITTMIAGSIIQTQKSSLERMIAFSPGMSPDLISLPIENKSYLLESWRRSLAMEDAKIIYTFASDFLTDRVLEFWTNKSITDTLLLDVLSYRALVSEYDLSYFEEFYRKTHEFAQKPIYESFKEQENWEQTIKKKPGGIFAKVTGVPNISRYSINPNIAEAHQRLSDLALAVFAYSAKNNRYPTQVNDLSPEYIRTVPVDPFDGKPLKMTAVKDGLILYSIGPDFKDNGGKIEYALPYNNQKTGDILFRLGSVYDQTFLKPALVQLTANGNLEMVRRALAAGADVNRQQPLVAAVAKGHDSVLSLLLEKGADINAVARAPEKTKRKRKRSRRSAEKDTDSLDGGWNALMAASANGHDKTVELLLDKGADPNAVNERGGTALMVAPGTGIMEAMEWTAKEIESLHKTKKEIAVLEAKIKELKAKASADGERAKKALARAEDNLLRAKRRVQVLEEYKAPLKKTTTEIREPDVGKNRTALVKQLLESGADVRAKDKLGVTALIAAAFENDIETVKLLIENGADINTKTTFGWTALIVAKAKGNRSVENLLAKKGASIEEKDKKIMGLLENSLERLEKKRSMKKKKRGISD